MLPIGDTIEIDSKVKDGKKMNQVKSNHKGA